MIQVQKLKQPITTTKSLRDRNHRLYVSSGNGRVNGILKVIDFSIFCVILGVADCFVAVRLARSTSMSRYALLCAEIVARTREKHKNKKQTQETQHSHQDEKNNMHDVVPLCVLDFYVYEGVQRAGVGRRLFDFCVAAEGPASFPIEEFCAFVVDIDIHTQARDLRTWRTTGPAPSCSRSCSNISA